MKFSAAIFLLLIAIFASIATSSAGASSVSARTEITSSGETDAESADTAEEAQPEENEAEEESEGIETEVVGEEVIHHQRKHSTQCVVPSVMGSTLSAARHALEAAHCSLGKVYASHAGHGSLVVKWQSHSSGSRLKSGSSVSLLLTLRPHHR